MAREPIKFINIRPIRVKGERPMNTVYALSNEELQIAIDNTYKQMGVFQDDDLKQSSINHLNALRDIQLKRAELDVSEIKSPYDTIESNQDV